MMVMVMQTAVCSKDKGVEGDVDATTQMGTGPGGG
jgi:hypothetical protein